MRKGILKKVMFGILFGLIIGCQTDTENEASNSETTNQRPNILLLVADDMGLSDIGPFGSEIQTPTLNKLANRGVLLSNFHALPKCSPSRSVLLTGIDNHIAGLGEMGERITPMQKGKPGYEGHLNKTVAAIPEILNKAGYHTYMVGKWHLGKKEGYKPSDRGFEQTFALMGGGGSHWADQNPLTPILKMTYTQNGKVVEKLPADFYSTKNYTDHLLEWLEKDKKDEKPFFAYVAYTAPHDPLHAPKEYIDKYKGTYDAGFDVLRTARYKRLKEMGLVSENAEMFPWNGVKWEELSEEEQKISAREMEVYAAMIDYMDGQIARIFTWLEESGKMDNTMIVFISDNGANGGLIENYPGATPEFINSHDNSLENIGLPNSLTDMGPNWATASMSPYRLFKGFTTEGGVVAPCIIKLPKSVTTSEKIIEAFTHISDLAPTFLALANASHPSEQNKTIPAMMGKSLNPLLTGEVKTIHVGEGIGYELHGRRAYFKDEWKIVNLDVPYGNGDWQLYNLRNDPTEIHDLSDKYPDKREELITGWNKYSEEVGLVYDPIF
jgi:arylsulfatase A-like enzyme